MLPPSLAAVWGPLPAPVRPPGVPLAPPACQTTQRGGGSARRRATPLPALPPDALGTLPTAAAAAAAASLLTATWLRPGGAGEQQAPQPEEEVEPPRQQQPQEEPPSSAEAIWAAAWRGVTPDDPEPAAAPNAAASNAEGPQPEGQQQGSGSSVEDSHEGLRRSPVLYLEGIRGSDRARLLALCLAALEAQVTALPPGAGMMANGPAEWRHLATALLALATLAAAAAWLGYVPARLLAAAAACLAEVPPSVLQAAGLASGAAAVQQQAMAAAAAAAVGEDDAEKEDGGGEGPEAVQWYCLAERLPLYSGVLRLLTCSSIEQQAEQQPAQAPGAAAAALALAPGEASAAEAGTEQQQEPGGALAPNHSSSPTGLARQQALAVLRQGSDGLPGSIRGWRASATGTRSDSQLLALAPAALQDWAVTAADAVAAAYLSDAADTGPSAAALRSGLAGSSAVMAAAASGGEDRQQQQQAGSNGAQQETALVSGSSSSGTGAAPAALFASSAPLEAGWWPTFVHRQLCNTRQLQRFANAVLLQRWLDARYRGVADMYEDRLRLWGVAAAGRRLEPRSAPLKRAAELGRLRGLRYGASLLLEGADLLLPLLRALWRQATAAASWVLVRLVGQAVALVRRGVAQGMGAASGGSSQQEQRQQRRQEQRQQQRGRRRPGGDVGSDGPRWGWAA